MHRRRFIAGTLASLALAACRPLQSERWADRGAAAASGAEFDLEPGCCGEACPVSERDWAQHFESGTYRCAQCGQTLFASAQKYDPGTPWPSFFDAIDGAVIPVPEGRFAYLSDHSVLCSRCHAHLGEIFRDGPEPSRVRYCILSAALDFVPEG